MSGSRFAAAVVAALVFLLSASVAAGEPRFSAPVFNSTGRIEVAEMVAGDVTGDRKPDLVTTNDWGTVSVLPGAGDGTFRSRLTSKTGTDPKVDHLQGVEGMRAADVNADGRADLLIMRARDESAGFVDVLLNDGTGRFRSDGRYATQADNSALVIADVNGDGVVDLLVGHPGGSLDGPGLPELSVLLGTGGGHFAAARGVPGPGVSDIALGDLNGDGRPDVTVLSNHTDRVAVRLGNGDGTFGALSEFGPSDGFTAIALADLNQDGKLDAVAAQFLGNSVRLMLGNGDGRLGTASTYRMSSELDTVTLADLDGDGHTDMITTSIAPERIVVRGGRGNGTFGPAHVVRWDAFGPLTVTDVNGDGRADLAAVGVSHAGGVFASAVLNWTGLAAPPCVVPPLTRLRLSGAKRDIRQAGCRPGSIRSRGSTKVGKHRVIAQRPHYGAVLASHARVALVVSRGRRR